MVSFRSEQPSFVATVESSCFYVVKPVITTLKIFRLKSSLETRSDHGALFRMLIHQVLIHKLIVRPKIVRIFVLNFSVIWECLNWIHLLYWLIHIACYPISVKPIHSHSLEMPRHSLLYRDRRHRSYLFQILQRWERHQEWLGFGGHIVEPRHRRVRLERVMAYRLKIIVV